MKKFTVAAAVLATAATLGATAQIKPEDQVKQRKSAYAVLGYNFANLGAMAQEKKPYNKDDAIRSANIVAALADYPKGFFGDDTHGAESKAKEGIWKNRADFDAKMDKMITNAKGLPQAAGDLGSLKKAVSDTGAACKACHDEYRAK